VPSTNTRVLGQEIHRNPPLQRLSLKPKEVRQVRFLIAAV